MAWNSGWNKIFEEHERGRYPCEDLVRFISRNYPRDNRSGVRVLEVGCGTGANLWFLAREELDVHGIDGSNVAIGIASQRLVSEGLDAQLAIADAMSLPYEDGYFDCVIDVECIYANCLKDARLIIAEVNRVLKPGGKFFSKTFMSGSYGYGKGRTLPGEPNTYVEIEEGGFDDGYGIIRFTSKEEIPELYSPLEIESIDYSIRGVDGGKHEIKEWIIVCRKNDL